MPRNSMLKTKFQTKLSIISSTLKRSSDCYTKVSGYVKREAVWYDKYAVQLLVLITEVTGEEFFR